jgi:hypothetical protein
MESFFYQGIRLSEQFKRATVKIDTILTALDHGWHVKKINENEYKLSKPVKEYSDNDVLIKQLFGSGKKKNG